MARNIKKVMIVAQGLYGSGSEKFLKNIIEINHSNNIKTFVCSSENMSHLFDYFQKHDAKCRRTPLTDDGLRMTFSVFGKSYNLPYTNYLFPLYDILNIVRDFITFRPNIVLASNINPSSQLGLFVCPVPTIIFLHTLVEKQLNSTRKNFLKLFTTKFFRNKFATVSVYSSKRIEKFWNISTQSQSIIPNGVKLQDEQVLNLNRENIILTVGDFIQYKNPDIWLEVAKKFIHKNPNYKFMWVGKDYLNGVFQAKITQENLNDNIQIVGYNANPQEYYQKSTLYFHPSLLESQGISILEAMSFGLPCVASLTGGIPESVINNETGFLCESKNTDCFVSSLEKLIQEPETYKKMSVNSYVSIKNQFSFIKNEQNIIAMYQWAFKANQ